MTPVTVDQPDFPIVYLSLVLIVFLFVSSCDCFLLIARSTSDDNLSCFPLLQHSLQIFSSLLSFICGMIAFSFSFLCFSCFLLSGFALSVCTFPNSLPINDWSFIDWDCIIIVTQSPINDFLSSFMECQLRELSCLIISLLFHSSSINASNISSRSFDLSAHRNYYFAMIGLFSSLTS